MAAARNADPVDKLATGPDPATQGLEHGSFRPNTRAASSKTMAAQPYPGPLCVMSNADRRRWRRGLLGQNTCLRPRGI